MGPGTLQRYRRRISLVLRMKTSAPEKTDFLVVGSGIAGLRAAIEMACRGAHYRSDFLLKIEQEKPQHSFVEKCSPVYIE